MASAHHRGMKSLRRRFNHLVERILRLVNQSIFGITDDLFADAAARSQKADGKYQGQPRNHYRQSFPLASFHRFTIARRPE